MVADARGGLRRKKVAAGGFEEFQHRLVLERGRIGEVDHHLRAGERLFQPLAGDRVDAAFGRGGDDVVAALAQNGDRLRADQAGAADDDDFHGLTSVVLSFLVDMSLGRRSRFQSRGSLEQRTLPRDEDLPSAAISTHRALRGSKRCGSDGRNYDDAATSVRTCGLRSQPLFPAKTNPKGGMASCRERSAQARKMVYRLDVT